MFSFLNDLEHLKQSDLQFKQEYKYKMVDPFKVYDKDTAIEEMDQLDVTLQICTLYQGLPHGLAFIHYIPLTEHGSYSFKGLGVFFQGKLHNAPFTWVNQLGFGSTFSMMQNGRPAPNSYYTQFMPNGGRYNADSLMMPTNQSGWLRSLKQIDKEKRANGQSMSWCNKKIIIENYKDNNKLAENKYFELQNDGTHTLYYNTSRGQKIEVSLGHKMI